MTIVAEEQLPLRFMAGADVLASVEEKVAELTRQAEAYRELSTSLDYDDIS